MYKRSNYQGSIIADTSPSGIEQYLKTKIENALGDDVREGVKVKPLLQIEDYKEDLSGDVKSGYGAIAISVDGVMIHVPFIIKDNEFLPFDSIRMGEEQVPYEEAKLKKLVQSIKRVKSGNTTHSEEDPFNTMSLGDIKDLPFDNGFLGTIMGVRDSARQTNNRNQSNFVGNNFGHVEDERMINLASEQIGEAFENFHEKLAAVNVYDEEDIKNVAEKFREKAIKEYDEILNAESRVDEPIDRTQELYRRKLDNVELVDLDIAANGKMIEFPVSEEGMSTRMSGKIFKNLRRLSGSKSGEAPMKGFNKLLLDKRGYFQLVNDKDTVLIYKDRVLSDPKIKLSYGRTLVRDNHKYYSIYTDYDSDQINVPFRVINDFVHDKEESGRILSFTELNQDGGTFFTSSQSTLFQNVLIGEEVLDSFATFSNSFMIIISREGTSLEPGIYTKDQIMQYIISEAKGERDLNVSLHMFKYFPLFVNDPEILVLKPGSPLISFKGIGIPTISKREELIGLEKSASFDEQNKARLYINESTYPPTYNLNINYVEAKDIEGMITSNVEQNNINGLSESGARKALNDIGFTHTEIDEFFEGTKRTGRYAEFPLPNVDLAKGYDYKEPVTDKVKKAIQGMVQNTLNAHRYTPVLENVVADNIADAARSVLQGKYANSLEVAQMMEKRANETRDVFDTTVAMLTNMKHGIDKLATDIIDGYVTNAEDVYEELLKVANFIEPISEELYYRQYRGKDELYKQAMYELDDLTRHAIVADHFVKEAKVKKAIFGTKKKIKNKLQSPRKKAVLQKEKRINELNKEIEREMARYNKMIDFLPSQPFKKDDVNKLAKKIDGMLNERKKLVSDHAGKVHDLQNKNRKVMAGIGIPSVTAGSFLINNNKE